MTPHDRPASAALTGTRIRERRLALARRQADVARAAGISAAYLNLIEHNRRPVGVDLISRLADVLDVPPAELESGREEARIAALREAAARLPGTPAELEQAAEFLGRFPGWAAVLTDTAQRLTEAERRLIHLSDRMSHDPYLPSALHEVLSAVTSLRASASILAEGGELPPEWADRFRANLQEDGDRLSATVQAVVAHLDTFEAEGAGFTPLEEIEAWMAAGLPPIEDSGDLASDAARALARAHLADAERDRRALPDADLARAVAGVGGDLPALCAALDRPPDLVMRRLVALRPAGFAQAGLLVCDSAGTMIQRIAPPGFAVTRQGDQCALLPVYQALAQPQVVMRALIETPEGRRFDTLSYARRSQPQGVEGPLLTRAFMLILPAAPAPGAPVTRIGPTCRICPRHGCPARREPSILTPAV